MAEFVHRILPSKTLFPDVHKYRVVTTNDDDDIADGPTSLGETYRQVLEFCEIDPRSILNTQPK